MNDAGRSIVISSQFFGQPTTILAKDCGGLIRSVTIDNTTSSTTAVVYGGSSVNGQAPLFGVPPGAVKTLPVMALDAVTILPVVSKGAGADGAIFVHADLNALAASGFQQQTQTPIWIWDSTQWDGGATWGS